MSKYYPEDERPPSFDNAIFSRTWGSFAVPVIVDDLCVGVLEFFLDTPKDSYDSDIDKVYRALKMERPFQNAHLQTPIKNEERKTSNKMYRRSLSFDYSKYSCLAPYFGLTRDMAAAKLGLKRSTFRNVCKRVGICEWPWIRTPSTNPEIQINLAPASETSSSQILVAMEDNHGYFDDSSSHMDTDLPFEFPQEQTTNARAPIPETQIDQIADSKTGCLQIPVDTMETIIRFPESWSFIKTCPHQFPADIPDYNFPDMDLYTNEFPCEQTIDASLSVPETQIYKTNEFPCDYYDLINTTNLSDNWFGMDWLFEQNIIASLSVPETQINNTNEFPCDYYDLKNTTNLSDNWSDMDWLSQQRYPGAGFMGEIDEMNYQGWIRSKM